MMAASAPMRGAVKRIRSPRWPRSPHQIRRYANAAPPPREYQKPPAKAKPAIEVTPEEPAKKPGLLSRLLPKPRRDPAVYGPKDPERGMEAAQRVVKTGQLDDRYKGAARRYTLIVVMLPLVIYLPYELYKRRFLGVERKQIPEKRSHDDANPTHQTSEMG